MFFKKFGDILTSIIFIVLSVFMIIAAKMLPPSQVMQIGPDFMPIVVSIATLILALILLVVSIRNLKANIAKTNANPPEECDYVKMIVSLLLILVYVFALKPIGFIITTLVYLPIQMFVLAEKEKRTGKDIAILLVIGILFTLAVFFLFRYGFKIVLPQGIFTINL